MKKITSLLALFLTATITLTSCSSDEDLQENFTVVSNDVFTDAEGFEFQLTWKTNNLDINADFFTENSSSESEFIRHESITKSNDSESIKFYNNGGDTFGRAFISVYGAYNVDLNYDLEVRRISDNVLVKRVSGTVESMGNEFSSDENFHNVINLGEFTKEGNEFFFGF